MRGDDDHDQRGGRLQRIAVGALLGLGLAAIGLRARQETFASTRDLPWFDAVELTIGGASVMLVHESLRAWGRRGTVPHYIAWIVSCSAAAVVVGAIELLRTGTAAAFMPALFFGPVVGLGIGAVSRRIDERP